MSDLTICISAFNNSATIKRVMDQLMKQGMNAKILIADNGSTDGTLELLCAWQGRGTFPMLEVQQFPQVKDAGPIGNCSLMRGNLLASVQTPFAFFLDADVLIPSNSIPLLREAFSDPKLGMYGIRYEQKTGHTEIGAALVRTEPAKRIVWNGNGCSCMIAQRELQSQGFTTRTHPYLMAFHLKPFPF